MKRSIIAAAVCLFLLPALSQATTPQANPRGYKTVPTGYNLFEIIYAYTTGNAETMVPIAPYTWTPGELEIERHTTLLRYVHYFDWAGKFSGFSVMAPVVNQDLSLSTDFFDADFSQSGLGDPTFVIASNIFGQPAMGLQEYIDTYKSGKPVHQTSMNWSLWVAAPMGKYDSDSKVNAGENRWTIKPEINFTHIADKIWFEVNAGVSFFTDNSDYMGTLVPSGASVLGTLEQDPLYTIDAHVSVDLPIKINSEILMPGWASLSLYGKFGGETKFNGASRDDAYDDLELSTQFNLRVHKQYAVRLFYNKTIQHEEGKFDTSTAGLRLTYIF